jgi:hypothetical protein
VSLLNAYAVLAVFFAALRLLLAVLLVGVSASAWLALAPRPTDGRRLVLETRQHLIFSAGLILLAVSLASWPLLYLLLQSYVPEWPGVMCIYGVTRVGEGSTGVGSFLPGLISFVQALKPALVFAGGAWLVLYRLNHRTKSAPVLGRVLFASAGLGLLQGAEAGAEMAYVLIPKKEEPVAVGCCTAGLARAPDPWLPEFLTREEARPWISASYYGMNIAVILLLARALWRGSNTLAPLLAALAAAPVSAVFLVEVAAPTVLHLPYHHCPYDLIPAAPDVLVGVAFFLCGLFAVGWACVAAWIGDCAETRPLLPQTIHGLLHTAFICYLGSLVLMSLELALA